MQLKPTIIIRKEGDSRLLYNGDNGGLIEIDETAFQDLVVRNDAGHPHYPALRRWLDESDFLDDDARGAPGGRGRRLTPREAQLTSGFYDLRSAAAPFNILWAITPRCNLRCPYCFADDGWREGAIQEPSEASLLRVADMLRECLVFKVTLTGGECLLSEHVWSVAAALKASGMTVAILSNGVGLREEAVERLRDLRVEVGVSLDGPDEAVNRLTRGPGSFDRTVGALRMLIGRGVPTSAMVTVTRHNVDRLPEHVALLADLGLDTITLQDLRPFGDLRAYDRMRLSIEQERRLAPTLASLHRLHPQIAFNLTELLMFCRQHSDGRVMQCPAGDHFGYIDVHGDFYPCTSLPTFRMGNLFDGGSMRDLWQRSDAVRELRRMKSQPLDLVPGCAGCPNVPRCDGGCRGDALFFSGSILGLPSRCPRQMGLIEDA